MGGYIMAKIKVCVIFGGMSSEYEVSLMSAKSVIDNIPADKYDIVKVGITKKGRWLFFPGGTDDILRDKWYDDPDCVPCLISPDRTTRGLIKLDGNKVSIEKIDVVLPVLHGKFGEDGTLQGLLEMSGIPYCGCGVLASAVCMDKIYADIIFEKRGIPHAKWDFMKDYEIDDFDSIADRVEKNLGYPIFVKPSNAGSSVGVTKAHDRAELKSAVQLALTHDSEVVFEEFISGHEVECAVYGNCPDLIASEVGEVGASAEFYDYNDKYFSGTSVTYIPALLDKDIRDEVRRLAKKAYTACNCKGLSRCDFFVTDDGRILINEINTLPGFTNISMYPKLMMHTGMTYSELIDGVIGLALEGSR